MSVIITTKHTTGGEDTFVNQDTAARNTNYGKSDAIWVRSQSGKICRGLVISSFPSYLYGTTIFSAHLKIRLAAAAPGANTLRIAAITSAWNYLKTTWNYRNPTASTVHTATVPISSGQTGWITVDITSIVAAVATGSLVWRGLMLSMVTTDDKLYKFYSMNYRVTSYRPYIEIEFSRPPRAPKDCEPAANRAVDSLTPRLIFDFTDSDGAQDTLSAFQIIIYNDDDTLKFNSGIIETSNNWYDVPAAANLDWEVFYKWQVRVRDNFNVWSSYSAKFRFKANAKPIISFTYPSGGTVDTTTPIIEWSYSDAEGNPQAWYQLQLQVYDTKKGFYTIYNTGRVNTELRSHQIPAGFIEATRTYKLILRVCDAVARANLPGSPPYIEITRDFIFSPTAGVAPVISLTASRVDWLKPGVRLSWSRTTNPNQWQVWRKSAEEATYSLIATLEDETLRTYTDYTCPRGSHHYQVWAVVDGKPSINNPTASVITYFEPYWLVSQEFPEYNCPILFWEDATFPGQITEQSAVFEPLGSRSPVVVTQAVGGFKGTIRTILIDYDGVTAKTYYLRMQNLRIISKDYNLYLIGRWQSWKVRILNLQLEPLPEAKEGYACSFDYIQVGNFDVSN